jgi:hypothetical protein
LWVGSKGQTRQQATRLQGAGKQAASATRSQQRERVWDESGVRRDARCAVRLGWVVVMPNQTMCRPSRRANKQASRVSRQSQAMRRSEERGSRGNWGGMKMETKRSVRRSGQQKDNKAAAARCVAVKHTQSACKTTCQRCQRCKTRPDGPGATLIGLSRPSHTHAHTTQGTCSHSPFPSPPPQHSSCRVVFRGRVDWACIH